MYGPWKPGCSGKKYKDDYITPKVGQSYMYPKRPDALKPSTRPTHTLGDMIYPSNIPSNRIGNPHFPYAMPMAYKVGDPYPVFKSRKEDLISKQTWEENITQISEDYIRRKIMGAKFSYLI
jgi:hypothetical protein